MSTGSESENIGTPTPQELREIVDGPHQAPGEAGGEVQPPAEDRAMDKVREVKDTVADKADTPAREGSAQAVYLVQESVVDPPREGAASAASKVAEVGAAVAAKVAQAVEAVKRRPGPVIAASASALVVFFTLRRKVRR